MAGKGKPGEYPKWLYNDDPRQFYGKKVCLWLCSGCGAPSFWRQTEGKHGTPSNGVRDASDPRYVYQQGPCWRSHHYGVKCVTPKAWRVLYHDEAPWPNMEVWARLERHGRMVAATERTNRARIKREGNLQVNADQGGDRQVGSAG